MCGIAGFFSQQPVPGEELARTVKAMTDSLRHRGPESEGVHVSPGGHAALGHRRLAFLDLSPTGWQPMFDSAGKYCIVFNGEIYNYRALREKVLARGVKLRSTGDCEVLLYLLMQEDVEALAQLRGMFAFAFWDEDKQSLLLARDRFGINPVVYAERNSSVAFGSEIRALDVAGYGSSALDPASFLFYLHWGSIASPRTWLKNVHSLPAGCWRRYQLGKEPVQRCFADFRQIYLDEKKPLSEAELREQVGPAVEDSVRHHLVSDVPVGVFLSGGIDSSSLVSAVRQVTNSTVSTYTISFGEGEFSEENIAAEVAKRFETDHHVCRVTAQDFLKDWPSIFAHYDQPTNDAFNSYYVSKVVAAAGQKVVLSGTGGDEFFGGYPSFRWLPAMQSRRHLLRWLGPLLTPLQKPHRREKFTHLARHAGQLSEGYRAVRGLFMPHECQSIAGPALLDQWKQTVDAVAQWEAEHFAGCGPESVRGTVSRLEVKQYLGAQLLRDINVMSMAHSLEVRVPLIDHVLAQTLWPALGHHPDLMRNKRLLYETLKQPLPEAVYSRPKQGFTFPMERWVKAELGGMITDGLQYLVKAGWLAPHTPEYIVRSLQAGHVHWSKPWSLAVFGQLSAMRSAQ